LAKIDEEYLELSTKTQPY